MYNVSSTGSIVINNLEIFFPNHVILHCLDIEKTFPYPDKKKNNPTPIGASTQKINFITEILESLE